MFPPRVIDAAFLPTDWHSLELGVASQVSSSHMEVLQFRASSPRTSTIIMLVLLFLVSHHRASPLWYVYPRQLFHCWTVDSQVHVLTASNFGEMPQSDTVHPSPLVCHLWQLHSHPFQLSTPHTSYVLSPVQSGVLILKCAEGAPPCFVLLWGR